MNGAGFLLVLLVAAGILANYLHEGVTQRDNDRSYPQAYTESKDV